MEKVSDVQIDRPAITAEVLEDVFGDLGFHVGKRLNQHGDGAFVTEHETLGAIAEEYHELIEAVRGNNPEHVGMELTDIAVCAIVGLASQRVRAQEQR